MLAYLDWNSERSISTSWYQIFNYIFISWSVKDVDVVGYVPL